MARLKSSPVFTLTVSLLLVLALLAAVLLYLSQKKIESTAQMVAQKAQTLSSYADRKPFPSKQNVTAAEADLAKAKALLAIMQDALQGHGEFARRVQNPTLPVSPTAAYFDLTAFVEAMRAAAQDAQVAIPANTRFGFTTYASTGPDAALIPQVYKQRLVVEYLLTTFFKTGAQELVSLQRSRPASSGDKSAAVVAPPPSSRGSGGTTANPEGDFFDIDPRMSAAVPGFINTAAFRISFVGFSSSLRDFLNQIATFELPLVVRSVEVDSVSKQGAATSRQSSTASNALNVLFGGGGGDERSPAVSEEKPIIEQVLSRFTVTIEYISLVDTDEAPASGTTDNQPNS